VRAGRRLLKWLAKITEHPVVSTLVTTAILALVSNWAGWWPAIGSAFQSTICWLSKSSQIPNWAIVLSGLFIVTTLAAFGFFALAIYRTPALNEGMESVFGLNWRWRINPYGGQMSVTAFCPSCDLQLIPTIIPGSYREDSARYSCPNCPSIDTIRKAPDMTERDVVLEIDRRRRQRASK
jgi:predicted RNA-binding Zn-ribbon protein involved in translation (DUF1610 family)